MQNDIIITTKIINGHFSMSNHHYSGVILHNLLHFQSKLQKLVWISIAIRSTTALNTRKTVCEDTAVPCPFPLKSSFLLQNPSCLIQNSSISIQISTFVRHIAEEVVQQSSLSTEKSSFSIEESSFTIEEYLFLH